MFEDCQSLREISFSNNFFTGEIKSLNDVFKNTNLTTLDMIYLRLYNLETCSNIFDGASIKGILKIGKYYSDDNTRDNLFKEIAKVTDSNTDVFVPNGTSINQIFEDIYYSEKNVRISVKVIQIDYNIQYNENGNYKLYSDFLHIGLGWDYNLNNTYDLDSSVLTFDYRINYLDRVNFQQLEAYNGTINLNGDDLTGEGEGDDEEIKVLLNSLPSEVEIFTVQINSYRRNSLKNVKSAYIRLSSDTEVIGTFSINKAGNNIGLLIGCFSKIVSNTSNGWYFRPLNRVIPGNVVTESVNSVQEILHLIFDNNRLISAEELVNRLIIVANNKSVYSQEYKFNSLYWNGTHWSADCSNLIKSIINGRDVYNPKIGSFQKTFPVVEDVNANNLILKCNNISNNFNNLLDAPRLLHLKDNQGHGHVGVYLGKTLISSNGNVNVIESTVSWQANGIIYSWVDHDGTRRLYEGGPLSEMKYNWTSHGSLDQWVW
jgi:stress response protein SCP2